MLINIIVMLITIITMLIVISITCAHFHLLSGAPRQCLGENEVDHAKPEDKEELFVHTHHSPTHQQT